MHPARQTHADSVCIQSIFMKTLSQHQFITKCSQILVLQQAGPQGAQATLQGGQGPLQGWHNPGVLRAGSAPFTATKCAGMSHMSSSKGAGDSGQTCGTGLQQARSSIPANPTASLLQATAKGSKEFGLCRADTALREVRGLCPPWGSRHLDEVVHGIILGQPATGERSSREPSAAGAARNAWDPALPLTMRPKSSAKVTPLLSRSSCEPVLLPLSELRRMMPAGTAAMSEGTGLCSSARSSLSCSPHPARVPWRERGAGLAPAGCPSSKRCRLLRREGLKLPLERRRWRLDSIAAGETMPGGGCFPIRRYSSSISFF